MSDSGREPAPNELLSCTDPEKWADAFCQSTGFSNRAWIVSWFTYAIATGRIEGQAGAADLRDRLDKIDREARALSLEDTILRGFERSEVSERLRLFTMIAHLRLKLALAEEKARHGS